MVLLGTSPLSVTRPLVVSTLIFVPSTPDSAIKAAFTFAVTAASSTVCPALRSASPEGVVVLAVLPEEGDVVEGEVLAQFVVDTTGRAEPNSLKVLKSSHDLFVQSVKNALPQMRFIPAEVGGRKVKQLVQQPFTFSITK